MLLKHGNYFYFSPSFFKRGVIDFKDISNVEILCIYAVAVEGKIPNIPSRIKPVLKDIIKR